MDINLEYYKIFYYVAGSQSITLAAEQLTISQPAVSQAVKHLEQALSCPLFVRTTKGVRLTKEGEMLYSYVQRGYETILSGERKLSADAESGTGRNLYRSQRHDVKVFPASVSGRIS